MEAGAGARQSSRTDHYDLNTRTSYSRDTGSSSASNMATAALISPNTPYYPHHPTSFPGAGYHSGPPHPAPGMISPVEPRRTTDEPDPPHRQSLPSIQEVIGKGPTGSYSASAPPAPPTNIPQQGLPSPFAPAPSRAFPTDVAPERQPSPRSAHHSASSLSLYGAARSDAFPNSMRPQFTGRSPAAGGAHPSPPPSLETPPGPSPGTQPHHHQLQHGQLLHPLHPQSHPYHPYPPQREREPKAKHDENPPHLGAYSHTHVSSQQHPYNSQPPQQQQQLPLPPAQTPLSGSYPASPRHAAPSPLPSPFESQQSRSLPENSPEFGRIRPARYDQAVNKHFEAWSYSEYLSRIGANSRTIYNFADAFGSIAREEHSPQPMPGRMPSDREVCEMINNAEWLKTMLENLRGIVQQTVVNDRSTAHNGRQKAQSFEDPDSPMYGDASAKPYALNEVKKRRGRAAPPGRCHSCNRIDTLEWRRGPDGARTLCNACGLHYAKLERKKQLESRALRPNERH